MVKWPQILPVKSVESEITLVKQVVPFLSANGHYDIRRRQYPHTGAINRRLFFLSLQESEFGHNPDRLRKTCGKYEKLMDFLISPWRFACIIASPD